MVDLPAEGTLFKVKISSTFVTVGQVFSIDGVDPELKMRDVTILTSTSMKKRPGIPDLGKASLKVYYDPNDTTTHSVLRAKVTTPPAAPDEFQIVYPDGDTTPSKDQFMGYVVKFHPTGIEVNGTLEAEVEIDITDELAISQGTP